MGNNILHGEGSQKQIINWQRNNLNNGSQFHSNNYDHNIDLMSADRIDNGNRLFNKTQLRAGLPGSKKQNRCLESHGAAHEPGMPHAQGMHQRAPPGNVYNLSTTLSCPTNFNELEPHCQLIPFLSQNYVLTQELAEVKNNSKVMKNNRRYFLSQDVTSTDEQHIRRKELNNCNPEKQFLSGQSNSYDTDRENEGFKHLSPAGSSYYPQSQSQYFNQLTAPHRNAPNVHATKSAIIESVNAELYHQSPPIGYPCNHGNNLKRSSSNDIFEKPLTAMNAFNLSQISFHPQNPTYRQELSCQENPYQYHSVETSDHGIENVQYPIFGPVIGFTSGMPHAQGMPNASGISVVSGRVPTSGLHTALGMQNESGMQILPEIPAASAMLSQQGLPPVQKTSTVRGMSASVEGQLEQEIPISSVMQFQHRTLPAQELPIASGMPFASGILDAPGISSCMSRAPRKPTALSLPAASEMPAASPMAFEQRLLSTHAIPAATEKLASLKIPVTPEMPLPTGMQTAPGIPLSSAMQNNVNPHQHECYTHESCCLRPRSQSSQMHTGIVNNGFIEQSYKRETLLHDQQQIVGQFTSSSVPCPCAGSFWQNQQVRTVAFFVFQKFI